MYNRIIENWCKKYNMKPHFSSNVEMKEFQDRFAARVGPELKRQRMMRIRSNNEFFGLGKKF